MASSSSTSIFVTRDEFKAFHKIDRAIFSRLVLTLRRDINQSFQVMSFLLFLEKSGLVSNLIANLCSFPDFFISNVADEAMVCLSCLAYDEFPNFVANLRRNTNLSTIPLITRMSGDYLTFAIIHQHRDTILLEMKKHLIHTCYPAFEDIRLRAEQMHAEERGKAVEMNQLGVGNQAHMAGSSSQPEPSNVARIDNCVVAPLSEDEQRRTDDRTVFLTFSRGYPLSQEEVHTYFTRKFGEIIEAIHMPEVEGEQALYARMVLRSATRIPEIVNDEITRTKFTINGKHVWARKYISKTPTNLPPSNGVAP